MWLNIYIRTPYTIHKHHLVFGHCLAHNQKKMNKFSVFFLLLAAVCVSADVKHLEREAGILRQSQAEPSPDGSYSYDFETENKISVQEVGTRKEIQKGVLGPQIVQGTAAYETPNGDKIVLTYEADEYGFRPKGDHIPPIPIYILRALDYIKQQDELRKSSPGSRRV